MNFLIKGLHAISRGERRVLGQLNKGPDYQMHTLLRERRRHRNVWAVMAREEGRIVGWSTVRNRVSTDNRIEIGVFVRPDLRLQGYGKAILKQAVAFGRCLHRTATLYTSTDDMGSQLFFEKHLYGNRPEIVKMLQDEIRLDTWTQEEREAVRRQFRCPNCAAGPQEHGSWACRETGACDGFICECDPEEEPLSREHNHGVDPQNPCYFAVCRHCGWDGTFPVASREAA